MPFTSNTALFATTVQNGFVMNCSKLQEKIYDERLLNMLNVKTKTASISQLLSTTVDFCSNFWSSKAFNGHKDTEQNNQTIIAENNTPNKLKKQ